MVAEFGGAQRETCEGSRGGHEGVRRGGEGRLELVGEVGEARLVMRVDGRRGQQPVWVGSGVSGVVVVGVVGVGGGDAQGDLVNYGASLRVGKTVAVLEERGRGSGRRRMRVRRQEGVGARGEGAGGGVGQQGVCGDALRVRASRGVGGAAVGQVSEGVGVDSRGNVGVRSQRPIVAVPLFVAEVGAVRLHLTDDGKRNTSMTSINQKKKKPNHSCLKITSRKD